MTKTGRDTRNSTSSQRTSNIGPRNSLGSQPPGGSGKGVKGSKEKKSFEGDCGVDVPLYVFTARTCLELLPQMDNVQIENEIKHLSAIDASIHSKLKEKSDVIDKRSILHSSLTTSLMKQIDTVVNKYDLLLESIHRTVDNTERKVDEAREILTQRLSDAQRHVEELQDTPPVQPDRELVSENETLLEQPVRFIDTSFAELPYHDVEASFNPQESLPGNRTSEYFGSHGYSYGHRGHISHEPAEYPPDHPILPQIFTRIQEQDPDFTPENYTCLVNKYPNGYSSLAMHQDNESCIVPGSKIYTVSFGAPRTLRLFNTSGPLQEQRHKLEHGSVHVMTRESQSLWKHGIVRDPQVTESRISLTFRWLVPPASSVDSPTSRPTVPPIAPPPESPVKPARILLLTDSIHSSTPEYLFETVPNHICIKQVEYQLQNIDKWSSQFGYTDTVVLSMGVNDLSRYGHTGNSLSDFLVEKLNHYSRIYPRTKFVFNSVLLTRDYQWCNNEIKTFNSNMFELSRRIRNLFFFDSHGLSAAQTGVRSFYEAGQKSSLSDVSMRNSRSNNGIHICLEMRRLIMTELVRSVGSLSGSRHEKYRNCKWLYNVTAPYSISNRDS